MLEGLEVALAHSKSKLLERRRLLELRLQGGKSGAGDWAANAVPTNDTPIIRALLVFLIVAVDVFLGCGVLLAMVTKG
jgi:hypothetical protein